ncbi:hypothetical protein POM88_048799 [Heracleum sosnowskyi]|uniref:PP2A regulatory subunit B'' EF-hand domain-containing protein n=1 Tax=Heracleum sosnowskyi TaxID=360622 RepID=A0AAD8GWZ7_9APIA|nr:hypothetical protein POM88_048799 [Heracleum sosnowskyi]
MMMEKRFSGSHVGVVVEEEGTEEEDDEENWDAKSLEDDNPKILGKIAVAAEDPDLEPKFLAKKIEKVHILQLVMANQQYLQRQVDTGKTKPLDCIRGTNVLLKTYILLGMLVRVLDFHIFMMLFVFAETVIYRILYYINRSGNGHLTLRELRRGNLITTMQHADEEEDINKVLRYFSYEHFYVIYCKFWELDTDHDFLIDKENLIKYGNDALTYRIVDRIFSQVPRKFTSSIEGKMGYEDFVYFMLAEEDKSSEPSLEYCYDKTGNRKRNKRDKPHNYL